MQPELIETILVDAEHRVPLLARHLRRLSSRARRWATPGAATRCKATS